MRGRGMFTRAGARWGGSALICAAAVGVWFGLEPETPEVSVPPAREAVADRSSEISAVMADNATNEVLADSAPQQSVVNGWVARDLLEIMAEQQNEALTRAEVAPPAQVLPPADDRTPALVALAVLAILLGVVTAPPAAPRTPLMPLGPSIPPQPSPSWAQSPTVAAPPAGG